MNSPEFPPTLLSFSTYLTFYVLNRLSHTLQLADILINTFTFEVVTRLIGRRYWIIFVKLLFNFDHCLSVFWIDLLFLYHLYKSFVVCQTIVRLRRGRVLGLILSKNWCLTLWYGFVTTRRDFLRRFLHVTFLFAGWLGLL